MFCFKDMTFCASPNCTNKCGRKLTDELQKEADMWAKLNNFPHAPISFSFFCNDEDVKNVC